MSNLTPEQYREVLQEIRANALAALGPDYPRTLPLGKLREDRIVQLCDAALAGKMPA